MGYLQLVFDTLTYLAGVKIQTEHAGSQANGQVINIAYGGRECLNDIYKALTEALQIRIKPIYRPERAGDIRHSNADISKARELLGYSPDWSFQRGIAAAIEWYKANL